MHKLINLNYIRLFFLFVSSCSSFFSLLMVSVAVLCSDSHAAVDLSVFLQSTVALISFFKGSAGADLCLSPVYSVSFSQI